MLFFFDYPTDKSLFLISAVQHSDVMFIYIRKWSPQQANKSLCQRALILEQYPKLLFMMQMYFF